MELFTLDSLFRRTEMVEGYESFIWTERYSSHGDIQIIAPATQQNRNLLQNGTFLGLSESERVMKLETLQETSDEEGQKKLIFTGEEISNVLDDRVAGTGAAGVEPMTWKATGTAKSAIEKLFNYIVRNGTQSITDKIPLLVTGSLHGAGNIPEDPNPYVLERPIGPLYDAMKEIADVWDLGFRLYRGPDDGKLYFEVYKGNDRTATQTILPAVIFSPDLETLKAISELTSVAKSKSVARVVNEWTTVGAYSEGSSVDTAGFAKRVLFVDASDIKFPDRTNAMDDNTIKSINKANASVNSFVPQKDAFQKLLRKQRLTTAEANIIEAWVSTNIVTSISEADATLIRAAVTASQSLNAAELTVMQAAMVQKGQEELAKNRSISAFDGTITQQSPYKYRTHYELGDLVEMRNGTGLTNQMLVTEQIFAADETGERAYPTLSMKKFVTPGTWLAWENTQFWVDAPGTWSTS